MSKIVWKKPALLNEYQNGNYTVKIYADGTKIRENELDNLTPSFPESFDLKITNKCDNHCKFCHEMSNPDGTHGDLTMSFFDDIQSGTEIAIGGGNPLLHPQLSWFLEKMKLKGVICNLTVNEVDLYKKSDVIEYYIRNKFIHGIGVSPIIITEKLIKAVQSLGNNCVIHLINGIHTQSDFELLSNKGLKILILGFKNWGLGQSYLLNNLDDVTANQSWLNNNLNDLIKKFKVVSFDNLALKQLDVKSLMSESEWSKFYMGDDGDYTMYIDLVKSQYALNSTSPIRSAIGDKTIVEMFGDVKKIEDKNNIIEKQFIGFIKKLNDEVKVSQSDKSVELFGEYLRSNK